MAVLIPFETPAFSAGFNNLLKRSISFFSPQNAATVRIPPNTSSTTDDATEYAVNSRADSID